MTQILDNVMIKGKFLNISFWVLLIILCFAFIFLILTWKSPEKNSKGAFCLHPESRNYHLFKPGLDIELKVNSGIVFNIKQIKNADKNCLNPYFPVILIKPNKQHDGWIHMVYTDSADPKLNRFIDYDPNLTNFPFYSHSQYFYDAPLWIYSLLSKPLSFWKGHIFAIKVDHENKTINCIGKIEWGFELSPKKLRPKAIYPKLLDKYAWKQAWQILQEKLPGYQQMMK